MVAAVTIVGRVTVVSIGRRDNGREKNPSGVRVADLDERLGLCGLSGLRAYGHLRGLTRKQSCDGKGAQGDSRLSRHLDRHLPLERMTKAAHNERGEQDRTLELGNPGADQFEGHYDRNAATPSPPCGSGKG